MPKLTCHDLNGTTPPQAAKAVLLGAVITPDMLGVNASLHMLPAARDQHIPTIETLMALEIFVRASTPDDEPAPRSAA